MAEGRQFRPDMFRQREVQVGALVGLVVGLLIGWFLLGWWLVPVRWVNAPPSELHPDWQKHYVAMVVDSYIVTKDLEAAQNRLQDFDDQRLAELFREVTAEFRNRGATEEVRAARELARRLKIGVSATVAPEGTATATGAAGPTTTQPTSRWGSTLSRAVLALGIVVLVLAVLAVSVLGFLRYTRTRIAGYATERGKQPPHTIGTVDVGRTATLRYEGQGAKYKHDYQIYDDGQIIGGCGLEALQTLAKDGAVAVCSVWLYETAFPERSADTCALVSQAVYENEALLRVVQQDRETGDVLLAEPGARIQLHHTHLALEVEVVDVVYSDPDQQFFAELTVALRPVLRAEEEKTAAIE